MGASLRTGLRSCPSEATAALVTLVDLPDVGSEVVRRLLDRPVDADTLARAAYDGTPGHPVLIGRDHWAGVIESADRRPGARDLPRRARGRRSSSAATWPPGATWTSSNLAANPRLSSLRGMDATTSPGRRSSRALGSTGYLADDDLATVVYLAHGMQRPLLLEGEPGTGKTALAEALAEVAGVPLIRLQCYEGIDASQALYDWDFPRQILHLRTLEAATKAGELDAERGREVAVRRAVPARPAGPAGAARRAPAVLLVDEVDRADDEFEAFLLEVLSSWSVSIPELGTVTAATPPTVVLTSNRTRELHDALKRRCLYHWIDHPGLEREVEIVRTRLPEVSQRLAEQVAGAVQRLRDERAAQAARGRRDARLGPGAAPARRGRARPRDARRATLGAVVKYREDTDRVKQALDRMLPGDDSPRAPHEPDEILLGFTRALRVRPGWPSPTTAPPASSRRPRWSAPTTRTRRTGPGGRRCARGPDDLDPLRPRLRGLVRRARAAAAHRRQGHSRARSARRCRWASRGERGGEVEPDVVHAAASDRRGAPPPGRRRAAARREGAAGRDDRCAPTRGCRGVARGRRTPWRRGEIDMHRTLRTTLRQMGEPGRVEHRRRGTTSRRVVLLVDVSASMRPYADALLRLAHLVVDDRQGHGPRSRCSPSAPG